jgi:hypothetical protein
MPVKLPMPIASYIAAENAGNAGEVARCFMEDAVVLDEGRTIRGCAAIKQWKAETTRKYRHSLEPLRSAREGAKIIVVGRLTGNFPGSPIDLRFIFGLEGDKIASLEIRP